MAAFWLRVGLQFPNFTPYQVDPWSRYNGGLRKTIFPDSRIFAIGSCTRQTKACIYCYMLDEALLTYCRWKSKQILVYNVDYKNWYIVMMIMVITRMMMTGSWSLISTSYVHTFWLVSQVLTVPRLDTKPAALRKESHQVLKTNTWSRRKSLEETGKTTKYSSRLY